MPDKLIYSGPKDEFDNARIETSVQICQRILFIQSLIYIYSIYPIINTYS